MFPGKRLEPAVLSDGLPLVLFVCPVHIFILTYRSGNTMKVTNDMSVFKSFPFWSVRGLSGGQSNGFCVKSAILSNIHPKTSEKPLIKPGLYQ